MASNSSETFAERAEKHSNDLVKKLFAIAERKETNIVLSADLTNTRELLDIADRKCAM